MERRNNMAKSKRMRVVKYSPVYGPQGEEIGHVVEDQFIMVVPGGELLPITDPCPWGSFGIQARVPADAVEVYNKPEEPVPHTIKASKEEKDAVPSEPEEQETGSSKP
jgi:hypothetical protein